MVRRNNVIFLLITLSVIFIIVSNVYSFEGKPPAQLILVSGVAGGTSFVQCEALSSIFRNNGVRSTVEPGGDAVNVMLISEKKADLGITTSWIPYEAKQIKEPFDKEYDNVAGLAWIGETVSHIFVLENKGVEDLTDIKGQAFANQKVGSGSRIVFSYILRAYDMTEEDIDERLGGQTEQVQLVKDEHAIGLACTTTPPSGAFIELTSTKKVKLLDLPDDIINKIVNANPGFRKMIIPAGTYPGQEKDNISVGGDRMFIVRKDMSEEEVYWITRTFVENLESFKAGHAAMADLTVEKMANISGIEIHPGAQRYYDEVLGK